MVLVFALLPDRLPQLPDRLVLIRVPLPRFVPPKVEEHTADIIVPESVVISLTLLHQPVVQIHLHLHQPAQGIVLQLIGVIPIVIIGQQLDLVQVTLV